MIDSVRNTVLAIMNKNNYGYLTPSDFNLYAKLAQLDIFRGLFDKYNEVINKENVRTSGTGYADGLVAIQSRIENFIVGPVELAFNDTDTPNFSLPTAYIPYRIEEILCYLHHGGHAPKTYVGPAERVTPIKARQLNASMLTAPSVQFPIYYILGDKLYVLPDTFHNDTAIECSYVRLPLDPKWTYTQVAANYFVFNPGVSDYQDFEVGAEFEIDLVIKILQYAGVAIRDAEVYAFTKQEQTNTEQ